MANTYAASTFVIDTSTNVAGLTALKGSAPALTDHLCISGVDCPTFTMESSLSLASLNIGFAAINGGSGGQGQFIQQDNTVLTIVAAGRVLLRKGSVWKVNGTERTVGTSNGAADQTFPQLHADNTTVYVGGELWEWRPSLNGLMMPVTATTNTTSVTVTVDPRTVGVVVGKTFEIRDRTTGALKATRVVTATTATTISFSGAVSVTAADGVYIPIGATEKVYTCSGGNIIFGDGTASAWNNNGGAIPVNTALIAQNGASITSDTAAGCRFDNVSGTIDWSHYDMTRCLPSAQWWGSHITNSAAGFIDSCSFHHQASFGFHAASGCNDWTVSGSITCYSNASVGFYAANGCSDWTVSGTITCYSNGSHGFHALSGCNGWTVSGTVTCYSNASVGFYAANGCTDWTVSGTITCYSNGSHGFFAERGCSDWTVSSTPRLWGNSSNTVLIHSGNIFGVARGQTGNDGTLSWRCHEELSTAGYADGDSVRLPTQNAYHESAQNWCPGIASYGVATVTVTLNGATVATEFRRSGDYGRTWSAWGDVANIAAATPDPYGEVLQFRVAKTDAGAGIPDHGGISLGVTCVDNWSVPEPLRGAGAFDAMRTPTVRYENGAQPW